MIVRFQVLSYNRANRAVAVLCNHQRAVPKTHEKSMENLITKIDSKKDAIDKAEKEFKVRNIFHISKETLLTVVVLLATHGRGNEL